MDAETRRFIIKEIERQANVILSAKTGDNTIESEDIEEMFPGMATIPKRPVMHPFGFVSRAPKGIISVIARMGAHFGNRITLGHRDKDRPECEEGETIVYNINGKAIFLQGNTIRIGTLTSSNPIVLGNETKAMMILILDLLSTHDHITGAPGSPTSPPRQSADFLDIKANNVDNDKILSDNHFTEK